MPRNLTLILALLWTFVLPLPVFAKTIDLYEQPKDGAKVIGTLDSQEGIIAIYTPEKSTWIKVADPRNGNVGWVKVKDLGSASTTDYTFTQRFINTGNSPQTYQIIQFGGPNKMTPEQIQQQLKQTEQQQLRIQENMNKAMQNMINDMNNLYHWNTQWYNNGTPFVMPVIVIPAQTLPPIKDKASDKSGAAKTQKKDATSDND